MIILTSLQVKLKDRITVVVIIGGFSLLMSLGKWNRIIRNLSRIVIILLNIGYLGDLGIMNFSSIAIYPKLVIRVVIDLFSVILSSHSGILKSQISKKKSILGSFSHQCKQGGLQHNKSQRWVLITSKCKFMIRQWGSTKKKCPVSKFT